MLVILEEPNYVDVAKSIFDEDITSLQAKQIYSILKGNINLIQRIIIQISILIAYFYIILREKYKI